ncbi:MAG: hypothetical protein ACYSXF_04615 [Planctomycetota bacterium]|jgi:hypothetical protein
MSIAAQSKTIQDLHEKARQALDESLPFEAERLAAKALQLARRERLFDRMAEVVSTIQEARRVRIEPAIATGEVVVLDEPFDDQIKIEPGCYLIRPPLVGADARRLRLLAHSREIPVAVVCREPSTQLRLCPIVAISAGTTVRTKIDPPDDPDHPDMNWFLDAMHALGDWAIETLDSGSDVEKRLDALLSRLDAIPDHEGLHECLRETCLEAERVAPEE